MTLFAISGDVGAHSRALTAGAILEAATTGLPSLRIKWADYTVAHLALPDGRIFRDAAYTRRMSKARFWTRELGLPADVAELTRSTLAKKKRPLAQARFIHWLQKTLTAPANPWDVPYWLREPRWTYTMHPDMRGALRDKKYAAVLVADMYEDIGDGDTADAVRCLHTPLEIVTKLLTLKVNSKS